MRCSLCGRLFGGTLSFDAHRVEEAGKQKRCLNPTELREAGLKRDYKGRWCRLTPVLAANGEEKEVA
jgi:hypothetical protein